MPWVPLAYIHGFPSSLTRSELKDRRLEVENSLHSRIGGRDHPEHILAVAVEVCNIKSQPFSSPQYNLVLERLAHLGSNVPNAGSVFYENEYILDFGWRQI